MTHRSPCTSLGRRRLGGRSRGTPAWLLVGLVGALGCSTPESAETVPEDDGVIPQVPVPAADGPKLVATKHGLVVRDRPSMAGKPLGTLALGAQVARAEEPYSTRGCEGGWYPIRPRGFVCAGAEASTDLGSAAAKVMSGQAALDKPLPYRYAQVTRGAAVSYASLPSSQEQQEAEPKMGSRKAEESEQLGAGSNDVPLDEGYVAKGPPVLLPGADGVGADGYRTSESFFVFAEGDAAPLGEGASLLTEEGQAARTRVLKRRSGVAITRSFLHGEGATARRFGVMPDGHFIPTDRLEPALGSAWHGVALAGEESLPIGFSLRRGVPTYHLDKTTVTRQDEELEPREAISLSGRFRTVNSVRYFYSGDEYWVRHKDIIMVAKRNQFPDWASPGQKWIDISLANQTLVAWEGHKPLYATLISSGRDRLGDPQTGPSTIQGVFRLLSKHVTRDVDDREVEQAYSVTEAPWVMEFHQGFSIVGSYWTRQFGEARSYHDVAVSPIDAHWLWAWSEPQLPEGWHSVTIPEDLEQNTIVYVHK